MMNVPIQTPNLLEFLKLTHDIVSCDKLGSYNFVEIIIGNESCDLDSVVSAILYSYFLYTTSDTRNTIFIPVLNIARCELILKTEVLYVLYNILREGRLGVEDVDLVDCERFLQDLLVFNHTIDLKKLGDEKTLKLCLVDHNYPTANMIAHKDLVFRIVDHHEIMHKSYTQNITNHIETVGSCCTLVFLTMKDCTDFMVQMLAYCTIITDTVNLDPKANKTTPKDLEAISILEQNKKMISAGRSNIFSAIMKAKSDVSHLSVVQLLKKDRKVVQIQCQTKSKLVCISSVPICLSEFCGKPQFSEKIEHFLNSENLSALMILTFYEKSKGNFCRQLAVISRNEDEKMVEIILKRLKLVDLDLAEIREKLLLGNLKLYSVGFEQKNLKFGRKQILPAILK